MLFRIFVRRSKQWQARYSWFWYDDDGSALARSVKRILSEQVCRDEIDKCRGSRDIPIIVIEGETQ